MAENNGNTTSDRLNTMLGFDPARPTKLGKELLDEVLAEVRKERTDQSKIKAKELLIRAMNLREENERARKQFEGQSKKFDKELSKVMNQIQGLLDGRTVQENEGENTDKE